MLIPLPDGLYIQAVPGGQTRQIASSKKGALIDPQVSPDGEWLAYVQNDSLMVLSTRGGKPRRVSPDGRKNKRTYGLAEYVAQEEMDRSHGFWWSPDSQLLAFEEVDESHIPIYTIVHQGQQPLNAESDERHHYPFAGQPNARVRLGIVNRAGGSVTWVDLGQEQEFYLGG